MVKPQDAIRLLLVEDSPEDATLVLRELKSEGLDVDHHRVSTEEELRRALDDSWDVVVSDYSMPTFDGLRAAEMVRRSTEDTPFIFVSGVIGQDRAIEAMRAGVRDYLPKDNLARLGVAIRREVKAARERFENRERLKRARDFAQSVVSAIPTPVVIVDEERSIAATNPAFDETFASPDPPGSSTFGDTCPIVARSPEVDGAIARAFEGEPSPEIGLDVIDDDGPRHLIIRVRPLPDGGGRPLHALVALEDVTERRQLHDSLVSAQRLESVGRLAGGVAHDFNNMLTVIQNFAVALTQEDFDEESPAELGEMILDVSERAANLTNSLLAFGRRTPQKLDVTDLDDLIEELLPVMRRLLQPKSTLVTRLDGALGHVAVDRRNMEQVLLNLVSNASDAMQQGGELTIATSNEHVEEGERLHGAPAGDWVVVSLSDTGVGMEPEVVQKAFEPFFTTREFGLGAGLGLSTVYGSIRQVGGHVAIDSRPGEGTTVHVSLPIQPADPAPKTEVGSGEPPRRILLVEDDTLVLRSTRRILERAGFECLEALTAEEALSVLESENVHAVVTDVVLPGMDGIELARRVRDASIPVVLSTGYSREALSDPGPPFPLVRKPFRPAALLEAIEEAIDE